MGLKDLLFKKEVEETDEVEQPSSAKKPTPQRVGGLESVASSPGQPVVGGTDYSKVIRDAIRENAQTGLNYLSFADALKALDGQALDDKTKFLVIYPTYQNNGAPVDKLVDSARFYISVVNHVKDEFDQTITAARKSDIEDKKALVQKETDDIARLNKEIQDKSATIMRVNGEINTSTMLLSTAEMSFNNAHQSQLAVINGHIDNLKNFLNANSTK